MAAAERKLAQRAADRVQEAHTEQPRDKQHQLAQVCLCLFVLRMFTFGSRSLRFWLLLPRWINQSACSPLSHCELLSS